MKTKGAVNILILIFLLLAALVLSALVGELTAGVEWLKWLTWGESFGWETGNLNLAIINLSFNFSMQVNVLQIVFIALALFINRKFF